MRGLSRLRPDRYADLPDALDLAFELVAYLQRRNASGRAGHDDVAGFERDHFGELPDDLRHVPDHLREVAVLLHLAIDLEIDAALLGMADLGSRSQRTAWRGTVEGLADFPWPLDVARGDLQVAPRQVDADAVAPHAVERLFLRDVAPAGFQRHHHLDLVVQVAGERRIRHGAAVMHDRVRGLCEEKRRLALVLAHLLDVLEIVAPDAPDAPHR